ncbi:hypothetical protein PVAG01_03913 [Phlyctema vagabunda]|uniref:Uncharacterized protein n=1 Tax=Phlyctema vagabunda TaxID=108571 RepID=A0ABR4PMS2_9HELO
MARKKTAPPPVPYEPDEYERDEQPSDEKRSDQGRSDQPRSMNARPFPDQQAIASKSDFFRDKIRHNKKTSVVPYQHPRYVAFFAGFAQRVGESDSEGSLTPEDLANLMKTLFDVIPQTINRIPTEHDMHGKLLRRLHHGRGKEAGAIEARILELWMEKLEAFIVAMWHRTEDLIALAWEGSSYEESKKIQNKEADIISIWTYLEIILAEIAIYEHSCRKVDTWSERYPMTGVTEMDGDTSMPDTPENQVGAYGSDDSDLSYRIKEKEAEEQGIESFVRMNLGQDHVAVDNAVTMDIDDRNSQSSSRDVGSSQESLDSCQHGDAADGPVDQDGMIGMDRVIEQHGIYYEGESGEEYEAEYEAEYEDYSESYYVEEMEVDKEHEENLNEIDLDLNCEDVIKKVMGAHARMVSSFLRLAIKSKEVHENSNLMGTQYRFGSMGYMEALREGLRACYAAASIASTIKPSPASWHASRTFSHYAADYAEKALPGLRIFYKILQFRDVEVCEDRGPPPADFEEEARRRYDLSYAAYRESRKMKQDHELSGRRKVIPKKELTMIERDALMALELHHHELGLRPYRSVNIDRIKSTVKSTEEGAAEASRQNKRRVSSRMDVQARDAEFDDDGEYSDSSVGDTPVKWQKPKRRSTKAKKANKAPAKARLESGDEEDLGYFDFNTAVMHERRSSRVKKAEEASIQSGFENDYEPAKMTRVASRRLDSRLRENSTPSYQEVGTDESLDSEDSTLERAPAEQAAFQPKQSPGRAPKRSRFGFSSMEVEDGAETENKQSVAPKKPSRRRARKRRKPSNGIDQYRNAGPLFPGLVSHVSRGATEDGSITVSDADADFEYYDSTA